MFNKNSLHTIAPPGKKFSVSRPAVSVSVIALAVFFLAVTPAQARDQIHIVGSSTVYPFSTTVAEEFSKTSHFAAPIVESTGTGGGLKLFCGGTGENFPDIANASRAIKDSERKLCEQNGVKGITEIEIGFDGIVFANSKKSPLMNLTKEQMFKALAQKLPQNGTLVANTNKLWSDIDPSLPKEKIEIYGPPTTSGTRDAFAELVMEKACVDNADFKKAIPDADALKKSCQLIREDGVYVEAGENDNLIVQKLKRNANAFGIFGYSFLDQNRDEVQASKIEGIGAEYETIADGSYKISRPLFMYVKDAQIGSVKGIGEFVTEFTSEKAIGADGYLAAKGLIALPEKDLVAQRETASRLMKLSQ